MGTRSRVFAIPLRRSWLFFPSIRQARDVSGMTQHPVPFQATVHDGEPATAAGPDLDAWKYIKGETQSAFNRWRTEGDKFTEEQKKQLLRNWGTTMFSVVQAKGREAFDEMKASLDNAPPKSLKGRLRQLLEDLRHGIDSREDVLKEIWFFARDCERRAEAKAQQAAGSGSGAAGSGGGGSGFGHHGSGALDTSSLADELEIVFPGGLVSADAARHALLSFVLDRRDFHRQYVWYSTAMLPVSTLAGALPGPNVFLAWNAYRLLSHHNAHKGAGFLIGAHNKSGLAPKLQGEPAEQRAAKRERKGGAAAVEFTYSSDHPLPPLPERARLLFSAEPELDRILAAKSKDDLPSNLSSAQIEAMVQVFKLPEFQHHCKRWGKS